MSYDPSRHHRRSIRLRAYDYSQPGAYFVTLVTQDRALLFDDPVLRRVIETFWQRIPQHCPDVTLDAWVVMPNHLHGILLLGTSDADLARVAREPAGVDVASMTRSSARGAASLPPAVPTRGPPAGSLGTIVGNFKAVTTRRINGVRKTPGARVWQRNYYERVVRNERELEAIREYIQNNPANWALDKENPGV
jgi:putative transposase